MSVAGRWTAPASLAALVLLSCGTERGPLNGESGQNRAGAGGEAGSGFAGRGGTTSIGDTGGAGGSMNACESRCDVDGGVAGTSGGASGSNGGQNGGGAGSGGSAGSGGADAGSEEAASVYYVTTGSSFEDASEYTLGPMEVAYPAPDRSLFVVVQSASNGVTVAERVRVNGVEATKLVAVGEDVMPSAPSALFSIPFPSDLQATVEVEMSSTVVRCAVSLLVAYGLQNTTGVDDSETLVAKTSGSLSVDVAAGGSVITALAMATNSTGPTAQLTGFQGTGFSEVLAEGTPTLILVGVSGSRNAGPEVVNMVASDSTFNFRAFVAAVH